MRLWHYKLIPQLDRQHLLGQHRECCALRGLGWGHKHATVDYVFTHSPKYLIAYHFLVIEEMERRGYHVDPKWKDARYRGKNCYPFSNGEIRWEPGDAFYYHHYPEHDMAYLRLCICLLKSRGATIIMERERGYENHDRIAEAS
jgi:uncharacterized protein (TIGR02328 family)